MVINFIMMKHSKNRSVIAVVAILLIVTSCFSPRKKKEETKEKEAAFKIIQTFDENMKMSGMSDNGLSISDDDRLYCIINAELNDYLLAIKSNGDDAKYKVMHGSSHDRGGIIITQGNGLVLAKGKFYGVTENGGENDAGTIYSVESKDQSHKIEYEFNGSLSLIPISLPAFDGDSSLFGLSESTKEKKLYWYVYDIYSKKITKTKECKTEFFAYGYVPASGNIQFGSDKSIYIADKFETQKSGCILKVDKNLEDIKLLCKMDSKAVTEPDGELVFFNDKIYGISKGGGETDDGLIYSINTDGSGFEALVAFNGENGSVPTCLFKSSTGVLYGTCYRGGIYDQGTFFQFDIKEKELSILKHFKGTEAAHPNGRIVEAKDGTLYGLLRHGGKGNEGALYSIKP